jgi:hypothetical protein
VVGRPPNLPPAFYPVERLRLERLTLTRYMAKGIHRVPVLALRDARTGFGRNAVITDGMPAPAAYNRRQASQSIQRRSLMETRGKGRGRS